MPEATLRRHEADLTRPLHLAARCRSRAGRRGPGGWGSLWSGVGAGRAWSTQVGDGHGVGMDHCRIGRVRRRPTSFAKGGLSPPSPRWPRRRQGSRGFREEGGRIRPVATSSSTRTSAVADQGAMNRSVQVTQTRPVDAGFDVQEAGDPPGRPRLDLDERNDEPGAGVSRGSVLVGGEHRLPAR